jgi:hypothetical protein
MPVCMRTHAGIHTLIWRAWEKLQLLEIYILYMVHCDRFLFIIFFILITDLIFIQKTSQGKDDVSSLLPSLSRQMYISEDPRPVNVKLTGEVIIPSSSVVLPPRDDAAEYDDSGDTYHFQDDSKYVMYD